MPTPEVGTIGWFDLTVPNAEEVRDFYAAVAGWTPEPVSMGDYSDFTMMRDGSEAPVAGICHARGTNASQPAVWMMYIVVADLDASIAAATERGGQIVVGPKKAGPQARYCVIRDPGGAMAGLYQSDG